MNLVTLKHYLYSIILLISCFAAVACSDDDDTPSIPDSPPGASSFSATVVYVEVDPSGFCPLAAQIRVNTIGTVAIRATVLSKPDAVTPAQAHLFSSSSQPTQFINVFGLYADYTNQVKLEFLDEQGVAQSDTLLEIKVAPLNISAAPQIHRVLEADTSRMEPGMNLVVYTPNGDNDTSMPYMVDADGEIRYLLNWRNSEDMVRTICNAAFSRMKDGNWLVGDNNRGYVRVVNPLGELIRTYDFMTTNNYRFHHEASQMANGNLISNMTKQDALRADGVTSRIRDHIVEWNAESGMIVHEWDLANMLDSERFGNKVLGVAAAGQSATNWVHNNAISDWGDNYLSCSRYQGVFKFKPSGDVMWILAPHRGWREQCQPYLLTPLDHNGNVITDAAVVEGTAYTDDFDWVWGPHAPVVLPDDNATDKLHRILVFDNGLARNFIRNNQQIPYSRAVIYEIDEENMTVRQVWDYGKGITEYYAADRSNAGYMPKTGNILFCSMCSASVPTVLEIDPTTNEVVYHLELAGGFHRVYRLPLYPN